MTQLNAMVRYEVLMAWRRHSLPMIWVLLLGGVLIFVALVAENNTRWLASGMQAQLDNGTYTLEQFRTTSLFSIVIAAMIFYSIGVISVVSEVVPLDTQFRVRELLRALPLSPAKYLAGKLLGVWAGAFLGWLGVGIIGGVGMWLILGAYDWRVFVSLWLLLPLPAVLTAAALSVLVSALVNTRRQSVLVGLLVLPFAYGVILLGMIWFIHVPSVFDPVYVYGAQQLIPAEQVLAGVGRGLLLHAGMIALTWGIVWLVVRIRELR